MDKEKILERSRNENNDEGLNYVSSRGVRLGYKIFLLLCAVLIVVNIIFKQNSDSILVLLWGFMAADAYSRYKFTKKKYHIVLSVIAGIASISNLVNYIMNVIK